MSNWSKLPPSPCGTFQFIRGNVEGAAYITVYPDGRIQLEDTWAYGDGVEDHGFFPSIEAAQQFADDNNF